MGGWLGLAGGITIFDIVQWKRGKPTLSISWGRWCEKPWSRGLCLAVWAILTHHLFCSLMPQSLRKTWGFPTRNGDPN